MRIGTLLAVVGWPAGTWLFARVRGCRAALDTARATGSPPTGTLDLTIVIPARDEAATLPGLLASLARQVPSAARVVVVDDDSSDHTAAIAAAAGVDVITAPSLPDGWTGKAWACWTGARAVETERIVFLDADTRLAPDAVGRLAAEHGDGGGLLSVQPYHETERAYEQASLYFNIVAMMGVGAFTAIAREPSGAFGPCLVCGRADYFAVDGHRSVRSEVVEDQALAHRFRSHGLPVRVRAGRDSIRFRMYPKGPRQLAEGWTKNFGAGARGARWTEVALTAVWVAAAGAAALDLAIRRDVASAFVYGAFVAQLAWIARRIGSFRAWAIVVYPLPLLCFFGLFARSIVHTYARGEVTWRGRRIPTRRDP